MTPIFPNRTRRELKVCGCCWFELKRDFFLLTPVSCPLHEFYVHLLLARFLSFFFSFIPSFLFSTPSFCYSTSSITFVSTFFPLSPLFQPSSSLHPLFPFFLSSPPPSTLPSLPLFTPSYLPWPLHLSLEPLFFLVLLCSPRSHSPIPFCLFFFPYKSSNISFQAKFKREEKQHRTLIEKALRKHKIISVFFLVLLYILKKKNILTLKYSYM